MGQEPDKITQLDLIIPLLRPGPEFYLLDLDLFLLLLGCLLLLVLIEQELAIIHDAANRGFRIGYDFNQVQLGLLGLCQCFCYRDNSNLLTINSDQPYLFRGNLFV